MLLHNEALMSQVDMSSVTRLGSGSAPCRRRVSEWIQLRLVDLATGEDITEPGIVGELRIDGPTVFPGYIGGESMPSPFDERGYLKSGDLFEIAGDEGQYLCLLYTSDAADE